MPLGNTETLKKDLYSAN